MARETCHADSPDTVWMTFARFTVRYSTEDSTAFPAVIDSRSAQESQFAGSTDRAWAGEEPVGFLLDHGVAFAAQLLELRAIQHRDVPAVVFDHTDIL